MKYTDNEMCTILLSSYIGLNTDSTVKPLSLGEWNKFVEELVKARLEPSILYNSDVSDLMAMGCTPAFIERLKRLTDRGASVGFELQEYEKRGIFVTTEISKEYPVMLRRKLKKKKPPVLFYAGEIGLANKVGIGVVGSRNVSEEGFAFTRELAIKAANEKLVIYSGGAKGVDTTSETAALNAGGISVSYLADAMTTRIKRPAVAASIAMGKSLLLSDQKPDAGFSAGRAMNRNKFIYASSTATFVVESDYNKGGTWNGALEAMKYEWGKVFVLENGKNGNQKLMEAGGIPYSMSSMSEVSLLEVIAQNEMRKTKPEKAGNQYQQMDLSALMNKPE